MNRRRPDFVERNRMALLCIALAVILVGASSTAAEVVVREGDPEITVFLLDLIPSD